jgi:hypothetical protein
VACCANLHTEYVLAVHSRGHDNPVPTPRNCNCNCNRNRNCNRNGNCNCNGNSFPVGFGNSFPVGIRIAVAVDGAADRAGELGGAVHQRDRVRRAEARARCLL